MMTPAHQLAISLQSAHSDLQGLRAMHALGGLLTSMLEAARAGVTLDESHAQELAAMHAVVSRAWPSCLEPVDPPPGAPAVAQG